MQYSILSLKMKHSSNSGCHFIPQTNPKHPQNEININLFPKSEGNETIHTYASI